MDYDKMPAGREMDAVISERVMGEKVIWETLSSPLGSGTLPFYGEGTAYENQPIPRYSEYISAAWEVVEKLAALDYQISIFPDTGSESRGYGWGVTIEHENKYCDKCKCKISKTTWGATAPLAISRGALKAALANQGRI